MIKQFKRFDEFLNCSFLLHYPTEREGERETLIKIECYIKIKILIVKQSIEDRRQIRDTNSNYMKTKTSFTEIFAIKFC